MNRDVVQRHHLQTRTSLEELVTVLTWFNQSCQSSVSRETLIRCQTVLAEAFTNVVRHAHRHLHAETPIEIEVSLYPGWLELQVWDRGPKFEFARYLGQAQQNCAPDAIGGRGIRLIAQLADRVSYERTLDQRNCFRMIKHL